MSVLIMLMNMLQYEEIYTAGSDKSHLCMLPLKTVVIDWKTVFWKCANIILESRSLLLLWTFIISFHLSFIQ